MMLARLSMRKFALGQRASVQAINKRVPRIYVGYSTDGAMHFSTITSQDGQAYPTCCRTMASLKIQQRRVPVGRGPKSPYWQYECANVAGSDFLLEHVPGLPGT